ncbi:unnamed protein product [Vicia faba]|uniref:Uncharacterized protein n=1 Tax=Vicia faba TaxID=3906 RepID=A0AAV1ANG7_VICFA|nr:unnamed protein product [Vicia faba]
MTQEPRLQISASIDGMNLHITEKSIVQLLNHDGDGRKCCNLNNGSITFLNFIDTHPTSSDSSYCVHVISSDSEEEPDSTTSLQQTYPSPEPNSNVINVPFTHDVVELTSPQKTISLDIVE